MDTIQCNVDTIINESTKVQTLTERNVHTVYQHTHTHTPQPMYTETKRYYRVLSWNWHLPYALIQDYSCITNDAYTEFNSNLTL